MKGRKCMTNWLQGRGGRKQEAGNRKRKEEEKVKGRKCMTAWLQGRGGRKQEEGREKMRRK